MKLANERWLLAVFKIGVCSCLLLAAFGQFGCSVPNLESRECSEARDTVKEFYSWYLGTDRETRLTQEDIYARYISPDFQGTVSGDVDQFFFSRTPPVTFKVGKCEVVSESINKIQVQLYWRQEGKTDQEEVYTDVIRSGDNWLIDKVERR